MLPLTNADLIRICGSPLTEEVAQSFTSVLDFAMMRFNIKKKPQRAMFLAQILLESNSLRHLQENLDHSATTLEKIWPNHFSDNAEKFAHKSEQIANRAYANRMGNGDEDSGDGWRYRGRGLIKITGRNMYKDAATGIGEDIVAQPDLLLHPNTAAMVAAWWWRSHGFNELVLAYEFDEVGAAKRVTMEITGGIIGFEYRFAAYMRGLDIL